MFERIFPLWVVATEKTLRLTILPLTKRKIHKLADTYSAFHTIASNTLETINSSKARTYTQLHHLAYARNRLTSIASQLIEEAQRYAWQRRRICERIPNPTIRFDKRLFSFKATERGHPILSVRANCERLGLPIRQDGAYRREYVSISETVGK